MRRLSPLALFTALITGLLAFGPMQAQAQQPETEDIISFQGQLTDANGDPLADGTYQVTFRLYTQASGGTAIWSETQTVETANGIFSTLLGTQTSLTNLTFDDTYYLGIQPQNANELTPRTPLTSVPFAQRARLLDRDALQAGSNVSIAEQNDGSLEISATGGGGGGLTSVSTDNTLDGDGTASAPLSLADGAVTGVKLDAQALQAGNGISISRDANNNFVIENTAGGGGSGFSLPFSGSISDNGPALSVENTGSGDGIEVLGSGIAGVDVDGPDIGLRALNNAAFGVRVDGGTNGMYVTGPGNYGLRVENTGTDGLQVESASEDGLDIRAPGNDGIRLDNAGNDGLDVRSPTNDGLRVTDPGVDGVQIDGAANRAVTGTHTSGNLGELGTADYGVHGMSANNTSNAGYFEMGTTSGTALSAIHRGGGNAISATVEGSGAAVLGQTVNGSGEAVYGQVVTGSGRAGVFEISNNASSNAVEVVTNGSGDALHVNGAGDDGLEVENADYGVYVPNAGTDGILVSGAGNLAGNFNGDVDVSGTLSKGGGSFKIDHPLDPENKYLQHSFVESPDMMNVYNGNVTLGADGTATVQLPDYFEALNRDFRYQLTAIGAPGPNLYVAEEISGNQFEIAGGEAGTKVSWQVTGVRQDEWAQENRIQVEVEKSPEKRGLYRHPEAQGASSDLSIEAQERRAKQAEAQEIEQ